MGCYVTKNKDGEIIGFSTERQNEDQEYVDGDFEVVDTRTYDQKRKSEYPDVGEQLDAILKWLTSERFQGEELPQDLDNIIGQWTAVKKKYPKPEDK